MGNEPLRFDRDGRAFVLPEFQFAVFDKQRIRAPRHKVKLIGIRMQIDEKVVRVAGVAVPKTEQAFGCPESIERIQIDEFADGFFGCLLCRENVNQLLNLRSAGVVIAAFVLKTIFPSLVKINDGAFIERAVGISKDAFEERLTDAFYVRIDAEVHAVDGNFRIGAPRCRQTDGVKQRIAHELADKGDVLQIIIQREVRLPIKCGIFVNTVQPDFEGGARLAERTEESFFADADARKCHAINRDARFDVGIRTLGRL